MTSPSKPTAFVSWAHAGRGWTSQQQASWEDMVRRFADALRNNGIDADIDLYHLHDQYVDWTRLGPNAIASADFTLVAVSSSWIARFDGTESPSVGAGAAREADALLSLYSTNRQDFHRRLKLVYLPDADTLSVPGALDGIQRFLIVDVSSDGLEDLLRTLHDQPRYVLPVVGPTPAFGQAKPAAEPSETPKDSYDVRTIRIDSSFVEPPHGQPPGWVTEPLLRLRVASYIAPMTSDEASQIRSGVRNRLAEALNQLELSTSLTALANQLTPLSALPDGPAKPPRSLDGWELNTQAHLNADYAMLRNGGDASSGIAANFAVSLPAFTHGGQATIWIDIGLSVVEQLTVSTIARLARDCLAGLPAIRDVLSDIVPTRAELGRTGITLIAPQIVGGVSRPNAIEKRVDFATMGPLAHPILGDIGVSFELSSRFQSAAAGHLTYLAFDRLMTDVAAIDPDDGLADLARRLGLDL